MNNQCQNKTEPDMKDKTGIKGKSNIKCKAHQKLSTMSQFKTQCFWSSLSKATISISKPNYHKKSTAPVKLQMPPFYASLNACRKLPIMIKEEAKEPEMCRVCVRFNHCSSPSLAASQSLRISTPPSSSVFHWAAAAAQKVIMSVCRT